MIIGVNFSEVRCLDVTPPKLRLGEWDTAFEEFRRKTGNSNEHHLIDASPAPARLE
jgi:hypothetical protein